MFTLILCPLAISMHGDDMVMYIKQSEHLLLCQSSINCMYVGTVAVYVHVTELILSDSCISVYPYGNLI